jgi:hypothetical protein
MASQPLFIARQHLLLGSKQLTKRLSSNDHPVSKILDLLAYHEALLLDKVIRNPGSCSGLEVG